MDTLVRCENCGKCHSNEKLSNGGVLPIGTPLSTGISSFRQCFYYCFGFIGRLHIFIEIPQYRCTSSDNNDWTNQPTNMNALYLHFSLMPNQKTIEIPPLSFSLWACITTADISNHMIIMILITQDKTSDSSISLISTFYSPGERQSSYNSTISLNGYSTLQTLQ